MALSITLTDVARKYGSEWIFSGLGKTFTPGGRYAITGPNGSGKSTLLKVLAGIVTPNKGKIEYTLNGNTLDVADVYQCMAISAPYLELPEELTLTELLNFHQSLRKLTVSHAEFTQQVQLDADKEIRNYSSGMKQRLKLALAFFTDSHALLIDEPTANLDQHWAAWYTQLLHNHSGNRTLIISSNIPEEYSICNDVLEIVKYKAT